MNEQEPKRFYQNPVVRVIIFLLVLAIAGGLYLWTTRIAVRKAPSVPQTENE